MLAEAPPMDKPLETSGGMPGRYRWHAREIHTSSWQDGPRVHMGMCHGNTIGHPATTTTATSKICGKIPAPKYLRYTTRDLTLSG